ncbi:MAG: PAS domain S-box protein [Deltaproteobacteria bacterium]|nr:PAS domain S-box protein [Deltaproteobacteria bacterium]
MLIPLRVLMIEDSEDDALLLTRLLKKSGYEPSTERVQTAEDMISALSSRPWDILLCDYHLPGFSALDAIEILKKMNLDIPLIIVSGVIGEETALDCIHRGASDYIMKGNLARLGLAVKRALENKDMRVKRKQNEEALRVSEEKYRTILDSIGEGYYEVDLTGNFTFFNDALCRIWGYPKEEMMGLNNRTYADPATARTLYEVHKKVYETGRPGKLFDYEIISKDRTKRVIQSSFTLLKDTDGKAIGFRGIVRDITELKLMDSERQKSLVQVRKSLEATIHAMAVTMESRDPYTAGHQKRVADLAQAIAQEMEVEPSRIEGLVMASTIHDLGKISIPAEILTKPAKLTDIEYEIVKPHAQSGYDILKDIDFPWPIARIILEHHERIDGSGYPRHLKGSDILLESKILTVADVVEAMASHRPYRPSLGIRLALDEIVRNRGVLYEPDIVDACLRLFNEKRFSICA